MNGYIEMDIIDEAIREIEEALAAMRAMDDEEKAKSDAEVTEF